MGCGDGGATSGEYKCLLDRLICYQNVAGFRSRPKTLIGKDQGLRAHAATSGKGRDTSIFRPHFKAPQEEEEEEKGTPIHTIIHGLFYVSASRFYSSKGSL